jgi:hypothetical protein
MLVALIALDKPDHLGVRKANRDAHIAYLKSTGVVSQAGPFLDTAGNMCGSLIILDVDTLKDAENWAAQDPYAQAGLFSSVTLRPWNKVI